MQRQPDCICQNCSHTTGTILLNKVSFPYRVFLFTDYNVHIFLLLNNTTILLNAICLLNVFNVTFHLTHFRYQPPHHLSTSIVTPSPLPPDVWLLAEPPPFPLMDSSVTTPHTSAMDRGSRSVESTVKGNKAKTVLKQINELCFSRQKLPSPIVIGQSNG